MRIGKGSIKQSPDCLCGKPLALILNGKRIADLDDAIGHWRASVTRQANELGSASVRRRVTQDVVKRPAASVGIGEQLSADPLNVVGFEHRRRPRLWHYCAKRPPDSGTAVRLGVAKCNRCRYQVKSIRHHLSQRNVAAA